MKGRCILKLEPVSSGVLQHPWHPCLRRVRCHRRKADRALSPAISFTLLVSLAAYRPRGSLTNASWGLRSKVRGTFPHHHSSQLFFIQSHILLRFVEGPQKCFPGHWRVMSQPTPDHSVRFPRHVTHSIFLTKGDNRRERLTERHLTERKHRPVYHTLIHTYRVSPKDPAGPSTLMHLWSKN